MNTTSIKIDTRPIVLSRGVFDLLKSHLRRRKLSKYNEDKLVLELRYAKQVLHKELPEDVVTVDTCVRVKELVSGNEFIYNLVAPDKAKRKNKHYQFYLRLEWPCGGIGREQSCSGKCQKE